MSMHYYSNSRDEVLNEVSRIHPGRVLEVGCGQGVMLSKLSKRWPNIDHVGVDLSVIKPENSGFRFFNSDIYSLSVKELGKFDVIILLDVLEHFSDSNALLHHLKQFAKPDTVFIFSIPNIRFIVGLYYLLIKKDFPETGSGIFDKTHLRFYTRKKIIRLMQDNGLKIKKIKGINSIANVQRSFTAKLLAYLMYPFISIAGIDCIYQQYYVHSGPSEGNHE